MIDRYHLRYFLAVVDTGSFTRAAAGCNVSQPTLSVGISRLEEGLGRKLFHRTSRRVELTEAGVGLLSHARAIEAGFAAAERDAARSEPLTVLRLGVLSTIPRGWIEEAVAAWRTSDGQGRIEIVEGNERDLRARLARGRIDMALTILRDADDRRTGRAIATETYGLALSATHPLADRAVLRTEDLAGEPMLVRRHCELLSETSRFFTARGIRPFFSARTTSDDKALAYVRAGLGITIMPAGFREAGVARLALEDFAFTRELGLVFAPHANASLLASHDLGDALSSVVAEALDEAAEP